MTRRDGRMRRPRELHLRILPRAHQWLLWGGGGTKPGVRKRARCAASGSKYGQHENWHTDHRTTSRCSLFDCRVPHHSCRSLRASDFGVVISAQAVGARDMAEVGLIQQAGTLECLANGKLARILRIDGLRLPTSDQSKASRWLRRPFYYRT